MSKRNLILPGLAAIALVGATAAAQVITTTPGTVNYARQNKQDSTLAGANSQLIGPVQSAAAPDPCLDAQGRNFCNGSLTGGGSTGNVQPPAPAPAPAPVPAPAPPPAPAQDVFATIELLCSYPSNMGWGVSMAMTRTGSNCSQSGEFTSMPSGLRVDGQFSFRDTSNSANLSDSSVWQITWSPACSSTAGATCTYIGQSPSHDALLELDLATSVTLRHVPSGQSRTYTGYITAWVCGLQHKPGQIGRECR